MLPAQEKGMKKAYNLKWNFTKGKKVISDKYCHYNNVKFIKDKIWG